MFLLVETYVHTVRVMTVMLGTRPLSRAERRLYVIVDRSAMTAHRHSDVLADRLPHSPVAATPY
jgi:hypothetical protein